MLVTKEYIESNVINKLGGLKNNLVKKLELTPEELYLIYYGMTKPLNEFGQHYIFLSFIKGYSSTAEVLRTDTVTKEYIESNIINRLGGLKNKLVKKLGLTPEELYLIYHNIPKPLCDNDNECSFMTFQSGFNSTCSIKSCGCITIKRLNTFNASVNSRPHDYYEKIVKKTKATKLKRYGDENYVNMKKLKETILAKYSVEWPHHTHIENYSSYNGEFIRANFIENKEFLINDACLFFNVKYQCMLRLKKYYNISERNKRNGNVVENSINEIFDEKFLLNDRREIAPLELDLYSEEHKFAIEYNGLMWHSFGKSKHSKFNNANSIDKNRHLNKTDLCEAKGIQLFHIFENEWVDLNKRAIWISKINDKFHINRKIGARQCAIRQVDKKSANDFLYSNHLQGSCNSSIELGLYHEGKLVSLMTFVKSRFSKLYEYELLRFCSKKNHTIQGAFSRLLRHFERTHTPTSLVSYANRRWSQGNVYEINGFSFMHNSGPNYFYFTKSEFKLYSRNKFQKHKLIKLLDIYDVELTEKENMFNNDYRIVFDSGNKVYTKLYKRINE